jgi:transcriptional regulator of acetoin/glycerol metabolism
MAGVGPHPRRVADVEFASEALRLLAAHDWPGNVRELRNVVGRALLDADGGVVGAAAVDAALARGGTALPRGPGSAPVGVASSGFCRERLLAVLDECGADTARVANALGVDRATVYRRMRQLGIPTPKRRRR